MDRVGFEPTSSRSQGEVTLPYTTSNLFHREEQTEHSREADGPASLTDEVTLPFTIPVSLPVGTIGPRLFELLFRNRRLFATVSLQLSPKRSVLARSNAFLHHTGNFSNPRTPPVAQASACELRSLSRKIREEFSFTASGFEPEPFGLYHEVAVNFTIPGTLVATDPVCSK
jgi:hypothetical protein